MKLVHFFALLLAAASVSALEFTAPAEGATYTGTSVVTFSWDEPEVTFSITGQSPQIITGTSTQVALEPGTYTATIANNNTSINRTVTVLASQPAQVITITTDKATYEVGTSARIRVSVNTPAQLNLSVKKDGTQIDGYSINVQQQTEFLYAPMQPGTYTVLVEGQGSSATATFTAVNTSVSVSIDASSTVSTSRVLTLNAQANGGTTPYTYFWQFSDNTTSTGQSVQHVFSDAGTYTATVIAQDATGKQASATKTITVTELVFKVDVTVMGENRKLLREALVTIQNTGGGKTGKTDQFGEVTFRNLTPGNYTINVTYNHTAVQPPVLINATKSLELEDNQKVLITLPVTDPVPVAPQPVAPAPAPPAQASPVTNNTTVVNTVSAPTQEAAAQSTTAQNTQQLAFEQARAAKLEELRSLQSAMMRTEEKQGVLVTLGLMKNYDTAKQQLQQAATEYELNNVFKTVPKEVTIISKDTGTTTIQEEELDELLEKLYALRSASEDEKKKYKYNVQEAIKNTTVTAKRTVVRVVNADGSSNTYTIFARSIQAPEGMTFIEFIPKSVAEDASQLHVDGSHEVLEADPVIRFLRPVYTYYVAGDGRGEEPTILPIPLELADPPNLVGFVAVKLKLNSFDRGGLYLIIIGVAVCIVIAGNVYLRKGATSSLPAFTELSEVSISMIEKGNYEGAAKYYKEVETVHAMLDTAEQQQTKDLLVFMKAAAAVHEFRTAAAHVRTLIQLNDVATISTAYERAMQHYESLTEHYQAQEKKSLEDLNNELEAHLLGKE